MNEVQLEEKKHAKSKKKIGSTCARHFDRILVVCRAQDAPIFIGALRAGG